MLEYLSNLVDLPRRDKWKQLEELSRLLDPNKDNRYVDKELWSEVRQSRVEMMMDPWIRTVMILRSYLETILTQVLEMLLMALRRLRRKNITRILLQISVMAVLRGWVVFLAAPAERLSWRTRLAS